MSSEELSEIRHIRLLLERLTALYKLSNAETLARAKDSLLRNETKKQIYDMCDGETSVRQMTEKLSISQPSVSYHLSSLVDSGLVHFEERGGNRYYHKTLE